MPVFPAKVSQQPQQSNGTPQTGEGDVNPVNNAGLKLAGTKTGNVDGAEGSDKRTKSGKFTLAQLRQTDGIVPLQSGTNQYDSQRGMTGFGMPRDVKGKHLKRIWELEFPEEAVADQAPPINQAPVQQQQRQQPQQQQRSAPPAVQSKAK